MKLTPCFLVITFLRVVKTKTKKRGEGSHFYIHERAKHKIERNFIENKVRNAKAFFEECRNTQIFFDKENMSIRSTRNKVDCAVVVMDSDKLN